MLNFLSKLDENLSKSLVSLIKLKNNSEVTDVNTLHNLIKNNKDKLFRYLEELKEIETKYFKESDDTDRFILSLNIDEKLYNKDLKKTFKDSIRLDTNIHKVTKSYAPPKASTKCITNIDNIDISLTSINIPIIKSIKDIPPMFYWYDGDTRYKKGIYTCISPGFYVRVPFPNTISSVNNGFKINSMPCKYNTKELCTEMKKKNSKLYNSEVRECSFLHIGEKFVKVGMSYRCNIESFGNHSSLDHDLHFVTMNDIKRLLMYSLSDTLISNIWYQNKFKNGDLILSNIDVYTK